MDGAGIWNGDEGTTKKLETSVNRSGEDSQMYTALKNFEPQNCVIAQNRANSVTIEKKKWNESGTLRQESGVIEHR